MPAYKLVFSVINEEITRDIAAASETEAIAKSLKVLKDDPRNPDIGTLFVEFRDNDYLPLCSLCPKSESSTPL